MNFSSNFTQIQKIDFKDLNSPTPHRHMIADIVLIDQTMGDEKHPYVYQLEEGYARSIFTALEEGRKIDEITDHCPFVLVGKASLVNRSKKLIHLVNEDKIGYQYLIVVTGDFQPGGTGDQHGDFSVGLQALIDALKIRPKSIYIPQNYGINSPSNKKEPHATPSSSETKPFLSEKAPKLVCHKVSAPTSGTPSSRRLFLVEF